MNDRQRENFDLDQLLHPAQVFGHPSEVVSDPDLTLNEKRAILASWAPDACAVEIAPELRRSPGGQVVRFDDIIDALRTLDAQFTATSAKMRGYAPACPARSAAFERRRSRRAIELIDRLSAKAPIHGVASMRRMSVVDRYVVGRHDNVFHVDFGHEPDPPTTPFPGAGSLRFATVSSDVSDALALDCAKVSSNATGVRRM